MIHPGLEKSIVRILIDKIRIIRYRGYSKSQDKNYYYFWKGDYKINALLFKIKSREKLP